MKATLIVQKVPEGLELTVSEFSYKYEPQTMKRRTKGHQLDINDESSATLSFAARKDCEQCRVFFSQNLPVGRGQSFSLRSPISLIIPTKVIKDADILSMSLLLGPYAYFFPEKM
ncbi:MAG: hypothetical protein K2Y07_08175 [Nitrosomonas sp.]|nr:hypothetical protein [Nitrosomonas sp.]